MKICFLSLNAYPLLIEKNLGFTGGAELQQVLLARELASHGYDISFVTYDHGQNAISYIGKIEILKVYRRERIYKIDPISKLRHIWKTLNRADADLYFYSSGSHGVLGLWSLIKRKKFIYRIPSDMVVLGIPKKCMSRFAEKFDVHKADAVVVQSEFQKKKLMEHFGVKGVVIRNALPIPKTKLKKSVVPTVLWVASISNVKCPQLFVELARELPNAHFEMIGGPTEDNFQLYKEILASTKNLPNFIFHGFIPYHKIDKYFERASVFVNTSSFEGFPNTFLQAWAHYVPVVSLNADPDGIIQRYKLGFCSKNFKQLVADVTNLLENGKLRKRLGNNARKYVEKEHDIRRVAIKYIRLFEEVCEER
jgi:glycosyltransferase involved in cell wall biosynthesis